MPTHGIDSFDKPSMRFACRALYAGVLLIMNDSAAAEAAMPILHQAVDPMYASLSCFDVDKKIGKGQFSTVYRA